MEDWRVIGPVIAGIVGIYGWVLKHASNSNKHPSKDAIVYKDVCQANRDCIETKLDGMEKLMEQGFSNLETLIKKNGGG